MKKVIKKKKFSNDLFFLTFIGEFVSLHYRITSDTGTMLSTIEGYLLDIDEKFYFVGPSAGEITVALEKSNVFLIEAVQQVDPELDILKNYTIPKDPTMKN